MFDLIADESEFLIINKHENVDVHGDKDSSLISKIRESISCDNLHMCHRLDKMTSGLMIFAKNKYAASEIQQDFANHNIDRLYIGLSDKKPKKKNGTIKGDLEKSRNGSYKLTNSSLNPSITHYRSNVINTIRFFRIEPITGQTHQIRVAMKSISSPLIGDDRYGGSKSTRMYLHAYFLAFVVSGSKYSFHHLPDFTDYLTKNEVESNLEILANKW